MYKLEGFDKDWYKTDYSRRWATYTNISPGTYTFHVIASNDDGVWNEEGTSVQIIILPPWWLTIWMKIIYWILGIGLPLGFYLLRTADRRPCRPRA